MTNKWINLNKDEEINQASEEQILNILQGGSNGARIYESLISYDIYFNQKDIGHTDIKLMQRLGKINEVTHNFEVDRKNGSGHTRNTILFHISKVFEDTTEITPIIHDKKELIIGPTQ